MTQSAGFIILGNGGAACSAAMAARRAGFQGTVTMVSDTDEPAFNPMLAPYFLKGKIDWNNCFPFGKDFYSQYEISTCFGSPIKELDAANRVVTGETGRQWSYDYCLVATGASPFIPPVPGLRESNLAFPVRNSASVQRLQTRMAGAKKMVVLGASLVGMKLAEIMSHKNVEVILVDVFDQVMPKGAHPITAGYLKQYFEQQGVTVLLGCSMQGLEERKDAVCCFFPDSLMEQADCVAVCTGIRPNIAFIDRKQVTVNDAIIIDEHSRTNMAGLYAAGDCAQGINPVSGRNEWLGTWGNACYQGRCAGFHVAGKPSAYWGSPPQNVSPFFDWTYVQIGDACRQGDDVVVKTSGDPFAGPFRLLVYENDRLIGVNLLNETRDVGLFKKAVMEKRPGPGQLPFFSIPSWRNIGPPVA